MEMESAGPERKRKRPHSPVASNDSNDDGGEDSLRDNQELIRNEYSGFSWQRQSTDSSQNDGGSNNLHRKLDVVQPTIHPKKIF
mmetsp:Transcript_5573/g.9914  ORF Transcript_5573/g.9914 Transcript_5573/m.9914 type:complete len:84 (+) Transcript_5573:212-463(+)